MTTKGMAGVMDWMLNEDGMIQQTLSDMQDPSLQIFLHAAAANNDAVVAKKWQTTDA